MLAGSPVSAECSAWFYRNVKRDLWLATGSGGTATCCGLADGTPTLPVYAGEIQARHLGVAAYAFNAHGQPVTDEVGELVVTEPMPSMPVRFWGDDDGRRYRASYFTEFSGRWRRHVPDAIVRVPDIPVTLTGKKMEVPVRRILLGARPEAAANRDAMANPASLEAYVSFAKQWPTVEE
jgi:acyl-coenzyme A synthetase/AMP-(fatty) acid ligase